MRPGKKDSFGGHRVEPGAAHTVVAIRAEKPPQVVALDDQHIVASLLRHG
jgi:hypothetical protein